MRLSLPVCCACAHTHINNACARTHRVVREGVRYTDPVPCMCVRISIFRPFESSIILESRRTSDTPEPTVSQLFMPAPGLGRAAWCADSLVQRLAASPSASSVAAVMSAPPNARARALTRSL